MSLVRRLAATYLAAPLVAAACHGGIGDPATSDGVTDVDVAPKRGTADGTSVLTIKMTVDTTPRPADGKVALTTTIGAFLGGTTATAITVPVNDSGHAYAQLKAPSSPGVAILAITAAGVTRYDSVRFDPASAAAVAKGVTEVDVIHPAGGAAVADGASVATVKVKVDTLPRPASNVVTLTTTAGAFTNGTMSVAVPVNDSGLAYARLRAPAEQGTALLAATAAGITKFAEVTYAAAPPERVQLTTTEFALKAGAANSLAVAAQLLRSIGTPSPGATVTFTADTAGGTRGDFGQFSPRTALSATATVGTRFTAGTTAYRGRATLRVHATRGDSTVTDSTSILITPP